MRQNCKEVREFCAEWWGHVEKYTERDQIAFAFTNWKIPGAHHSISWDYTYRKEFIHNPHKHKGWSGARHKELIQKYGSNKTS